MRPMNNFISSVARCSLPFFRLMFKKRRILRLISCLCAAVILLSSVSFAYPVFAQETAAQSEQIEQSLELYPCDEDRDCSVTLSGVMPKDASADAVDVTWDYPEACMIDEDVSDDAFVLAAYDITITDRDEEFQPGEENPIYVEIVNPGIDSSESVQLWHIHDDGTREQVEDFVISDGMISFYADGFSVYAIISVPSPRTFASASTVEELTSERGQGGFCLSYSTDIYWTSTLNNNGAFVETTEAKDAAVWYFENNNGDLTIYTYVDGAKKYIHNKSGNLLELSNNVADLFEVSIPTSGYFLFKKKGASLWLQHSGSGSGIRYYTNSSNAANCRMRAAYADAMVPIDDYYQLDGKTCGLMNYAGGTMGNAFMATGDSNYLTMMSLIVRADNASHTMYVAEDSEISMWTFHWVYDSNYTLSTELNGETKYLNIGNSLTLSDTPQEITVLSNSNNQLRLSANGKSVTFSDDGFTSAATITSSSNTTQWLHIVELSGLSYDDYITYSADKVGVSDVKDGSSVLVYTRIWNDVEKTYEFYAVDYDGSLYPCYERGNNIMWVGKRINTLLWDLTEYHYDDGSPNYYYELYNSYSRYYIAPQLRGSQTLSRQKIGINLPGRRAGEYYTDILAWDDSYYSYAGLVQDIENNCISVGSKAEADTFYFALVESAVPTLTKVNTIDNTEYGISMKMIDFPVQPDKVTGEYYQNDFLGTSTNSTPAGTKNLLSTDIGENGYPIATRTNLSLADLFAGATDVNHLFLESTYNASGYFEFDSCQNFATLVQENGSRGSDFIVYKELGTTDNTAKSTLSHGQFFPYDTIHAGVYSTKNPENLYSALANPNNDSIGILPDTDPRKYERLHTVGTNPNYYNGMEMTAGFVQTPSGRDSWGHDIIFEFTGDDDFWLYVDGELIIDLGGIHSALAGNVNFATGNVTVDGTTRTLRQIFRSNYVSRNPSATSAEIDAYLARYFEEGEDIFTDYSAHTMNIYYMERGAGASNLHMRFNLSYVTPGHVMLTKSVTGSDDLDFNLVEYPYQIWYKEEDDIGLERLLHNDDKLVSVTYQNSTQTVDYRETFTPPNSSTSYESVYFLTPGMSAEIHFPANTIEYRIIECGVNEEVYDVVRVNGAAIEGESIDNTNRHSFDSGWLMVSERPTVLFENHVRENSLRTLSVQKRLFDASGAELTPEQDRTTFSFRLYLSNGVTDDMELADMYRYYVKNTGGYICSWDAVYQRFNSTLKTNLSDLTEEEAHEYAFYTSMNGSISKIPAGYTVEVPNIPVGTKFRVEERESEIPLGYSLIGYERESGTYHTEDGDTLNSGWVRANESPKMYILNQRGWGIEVNKEWSDISFTDSHDDIFTAVYIGDSLLQGSVRQLSHPDTSVRYFFNSLQDGADFADYLVYEVELENPTFDANGTLLRYDGISRRISDGDAVTLSAVAKNSGTPSLYSYKVGYEWGTPYSVTAEGTDSFDNAVTHVITNTRSGGVILSLYDMNTHDPLMNGIFVLTSNGERLGTFTSDDEGRITILYDFERDRDYVLTQTQTPSGYIGLPDPMTFRIGGDDTPALTGNASNWQTGYKSTIVGDDVVAYIEVFNKPFTLRAVKTDDVTGETLSGAHFALYRSIHGVGGAVKDINPLDGYEDLVTDGSGVIPLIDNTLEAGKYYLTELSAPQNYEGLSEDIIFTVSATGDVYVESAEEGVALTVTDSDEKTCLITVPNTRVLTDATLTITKTVGGAFGDRTKSFRFVLEVENAKPSDEYQWTLNGVVQDTPLRSNSGFRLMHSDVVTVNLPMYVDITIAEDSEDYTASYRIDDNEASETDAVTFVMSGDTRLAVTNTLDGLIPVGVDPNHPELAAIVLAAVTAAAVFLIKKYRKPF